MPMPAIFERIIDASNEAYERFEQLPRFIWWSALIIGRLCVIVAAVLAWACLRSEIIFDVQALSPANLSGFAIFGIIVILAVGLEVVRLIAGLADLGSASRIGGWVFGKVCLAVAVYSAYAAGTTLYAMNNSVRNEPVRGPQSNLDTAPRKRPVAEFSVIEQRNLFGSKVVEAASSSSIAESKLKLRLVGTSVSMGGPSGLKGVPFALIEDSNKNIQDLFEINERIFNQAKLVKILVDRVQIEVESRGTKRVETLMLDAGNPASGIAEPTGDETDIVVAEDELSNALANLPKLLSDARAVPYFRNGQSIGMRLFAIRTGSLYEKVALKNGDIIKSVNDNSLSDPSQALKLFEQLKTERSIGVKVERDGQDVELRYSIR